MREVSSERYTRMVEEQRTAAGQSYEDEGMRSDERQKPKYQSLIHQQRVEYGK
ncbi:hypothetical protein D3C77_812230 [compost metagenome]